MDRRPNPKRYSLNIENVRANGSRSEDASLLFHDALKKMDGVIGFGSSAEVSTFGHESSSAKIAYLCEELKAILMSTHQNGTDLRLEIPTETRDAIVAWLLGDPRGSPVTNQLHKDRETLLQQVQVLERKLEVSQSENESLKTSMIEIQKKMSGSHVDLNLPQHTRTNSAGALQFYEDNNNSNLPRNTSATVAANSSASLPHHYDRTASSSSSVGNGNLKRNRSFRESFRKAFNRKKRNSKDLGQENDGSLKPLNARAQHFYSLNGPDLADWMNSIGLEMYGELISQLVGTGERLSSISTNTEDLMRLGVLNVLHCKKLKLAVEDAVADAPGPLSKLDHRWVSDWLRDVGLPQYQQPFMDARMDAQMLNAITLEDLEFLNIDHPFHIISLKRALQAFRMCGFDPNYLKIGQEKGGYKLMNWSVYHLMDWLREIELDEYAGALQGTGINGPVVALESSLTHQSIAKAVGISQSKALIVTHLGEKFVNIIGPIFAQKKVDMMQHKHFVPLDVTTEAPKGKSRSKSAKKSKHGQHSEENYLCPRNEVLPVLPKPCRPAVHMARGSMRGGGGGTATKSVTDVWCNSTVSSGNRRSLVYSPSPQDHFPAANSPPPPINGISSSAINLTYRATPTVPSPVAPTSMPPQATGAPPPPPPPPPAPPITNGF